MAMGSGYDRPHWNPEAGSLKPSAAALALGNVTAQSMLKAAEDCKFSVGDVVRLLSGGPFMTVIEVDGWFSSFTCGWFDMSHAHHTAIFNERVLVAVPA